MPPAYTGRSLDVPLAPVDAFDNRSTSCASPFGAQSLVGSVWQWTNSMEDAHTRVGLLKGGSPYWRVDSAEQVPALKNRSRYYFPNCARAKYSGRDCHGTEACVTVKPRLLASSMNRLVHALLACASSTLIE